FRRGDDERNSVGNAILGLDAQKPVEVEQVIWASMLLPDEFRVGDLRLITDLGPEFSLVLELLLVQCVGPGLIGRERHGGKDQPALEKAVLVDSGLVVSHDRGWQQQW